jgi:hypothetical protein
MEQQYPATGVWRPAVRVSKFLSMVKLFFFLFYFLAPATIIRIFTLFVPEFFSWAPFSQESNHLRITHWFIILRASFVDL